MVDQLEAVIARESGRSSKGELNVAHRLRQPLCR
jgi:hypothetical protein